MHAITDIPPKLVKMNILNFIVFLYADNDKTNNNLNGYILLNMNAKIFAN